MNKLIFYLFCKYYSLINPQQKINSFLLAHRGLTSKHLENTLEAFLEAINLGADGVELDVQITKDKYLIVFHDDNLQRLSNNKKYIQDINYEEIKNIKLKTPKYVQEYNICLLEEVLEKMPDKSIINIELKESFLKADSDTYKYLLNLINKYNEKFILIISSFHIDAIKPLIKHKNNFKIAFLIENKINIKELIKALIVIKYIDFINTHIDLLLNYSLKNINLIIWGHKKISNSTHIMRKNNISIISDICEQFFK